MNCHSNQQTQKVSKHKSSICIQRSWCFWNPFHLLFRTNML